MLEFWQNLASEPAKLMGVISAFLVGFLALINILMFFRPSARLKRAQLREEYKKHKLINNTIKNNKQIDKNAKKAVEKEIKELGFNNVYKDDLIELSSHNKKIKLVFKLDDDENTSFGEELTNAYLHAAKKIESGEAKLIL